MGAGILGLLEKLLSPVQKTGGQEGIPSEKYKNEPEEIRRNRAALEDFVHKKCYKGGNRGYINTYEARAKRDNQYLIDNLVHREDIQRVVENTEKARQSLIDRLNSVPHNFRQDVLLKYKDYDERPEGVHLLTPRQLLRVYLLLEALEKKPFLDNIGELLKNALKEPDPYKEHGGLVLFDANGEVKFHNIESEPRDEYERAHGLVMYKRSEESLDIPNIAKYHFHADNGEGCAEEMGGPSEGWDIWHSGDLFSCDLWTCIGGEVHNLVVTGLEDSRFNIDFYSGERKEGKKFGDHVADTVGLDLGNYEYELQSKEEQS